MNKNFLNIIRFAVILLIVGVFLFFLVYTVFLPRAKYSNYDVLTSKPDLTAQGLIDGTYTEQFGDYFSDTVHNRDWFKDAYASIRDLFGIRTKDGDEEVVIRDESSEPDDEPSVPVQESSGEPVSAEVSGNESGSTSAPEHSGSESSADTSVPAEESSRPPETSQGGKTPVADNPEISGSVLVMTIDGHTWALEIYGGDANLKTIPRYTAVLNSFAERNPDIHVSSMVIPKAAAYYLEYSEKYASRAGNCLRDMNAIAERLSDKVTNINIYDVLKEHRDEPIYFRTDHHWTQLGAYYAAKKLAEELHLPFAEISNYEETLREGYIGTMYNYSDKNPRILRDPEIFPVYAPPKMYSASYYDQKFNYIRDHDILWSVPDDKRSSWYMTFLNGDSYSWKVHSNLCSNGRKVLVVKDSYGNSLIPFLLYSFEEVYVVDARKFELNLNTFVRQEGITDVLFSEVAFSAVSSGYIGDLEKLCK